MNEPTGWNGIPNIRERLDNMEPMRKGQAIFGSNGLATIVFDEPLPSEPRIIAQAINSAGDPVFVETESKQESSGEWTGCVLRGYRMRGLPSPLVLLSALIGFRVFNFNNMAGVKVDWIAT